MARVADTAVPAQREGPLGRFSWAAKGLATAGAVVLARRGKKSRAGLVLGGTLVSVGELCLRWAVLKAGSQSTREEERT
ncbi:MAG TPA: hypothetical protein VFJ11_00160 [Gaiellaceae bacterium]|nr:hypothetical protein [Gaiellaceae bacterium]